MDDVWLTARVPLDDRRKLDQLARRAGLTRSAALRALLSAVGDIDPARVTFDGKQHNGAGLLAEQPRAAA